MKKEERRDTGQHKEENAVGSIPTTMRGLTLQMIDQRRGNTAGRNLMMQKAIIEPSMFENQGDNCEMGTKKDILPAMQKDQ